MKIDADRVKSKHVLALLASFPLVSFVAILASPPCPPSPLRSVDAMVRPRHDAIGLPLVSW